MTYRKVCYRPKLSLDEVNFIMKLIHNTNSYETDLGKKIITNLYWVKEVK